jgi:hypothetical protein
MKWKVSEQKQIDAETKTVILTDEEYPTFIAELRDLITADYIVHVHNAMDVVLDALEFYAEPLTYFAVSVLSDPPSGAIMEDFSRVEREIDGVIVNVPGKMAREALEALRKESK